MGTRGLGGAGGPGAATGRSSGGDGAPGGAWEAGAGLRSGRRGSSEISAGGIALSASAESRIKSAPSMRLRRSASPRNPRMIALSLRGPCAAVPAEGGPEGDDPGGGGSTRDGSAVPAKRGSRTGRPCVGGAIVLGVGRLIHQPTQPRIVPPRIEPSPPAEAPKTNPTKVSSATVQIRPIQNHPALTVLRNGRCIGDHPLESRARSLRAFTFLSRAVSYVCRHTDDSTTNGAGLGQGTRCPRAAKARYGHPSRPCHSDRLPTRGAQPWQPHGRFQTAPTAR